MICNNVKLLLSVINIQHSICDCHLFFLFCALHSAHHMSTYNLPPTSLLFKLILSIGCFTVLYLCIYISLVCTEAKSEACLTK